MSERTIEKLKVVFEPNSDPLDSALADALLTHLMVTVSRVGLNADRPNSINDIIKEEKEHGNKKKQGHHSRLRQEK